MPDILFPIIMAVGIGVLVLIMRAEARRPPRSDVRKPAGNHKSSRKRRPIDSRRPRRQQVGPRPAVPDDAAVTATAERHTTADDQPPTPLDEPAPHTHVTPPSADEAMAPTVEDQGVPPVATPATVQDAFTEAIDRITKADRFSGDRDRVVEELAGSSFNFAATIDRVDWTLGFDMAEPYRNGRTVIGRPANAKTSVLMRFTSSDNERIDALKPEMKIQVTGVLSGWDNVHNRPEVDVTSFDVGE